MFYLQISLGSSNVRVGSQIFGSRDVSVSKSQSNDSSSSHDKASHSTSSSHDQAGQSSSSHDKAGHSTKANTEQGDATHTNFNKTPAADDAVCSHDDVMSRVNDIAFNGDEGISEPLQNASI